MHVRYPSLFESSPRPAPRPSAKPLLNVSHGSFNQPHGPVGFKTGREKDDVRTRTTLDVPSPSSSSLARFCLLAAVEDATPLALSVPTQVKSVDVIEGAADDLAF